MDPETRPQMENVFDAPKDAPNVHQPNREAIDTGRYHPWDHSSAVVCDDCGCLVINVPQHDIFHDGLE